jgi:aconitate decarboxylase
LWNSLDTIRDVTDDPTARPSATLAEWASSIGSDEIPPAVRERTAHLLLDSVASALAGRHGDETAQVERAAAALAPGDQATVIGAGTLSPLGAVFLNGYQVTAVTVCDVYRPALCHVTPEVIPPALAIAEGGGSSGRDLVTALAVGLEVTARLGRGIDYAAFRQRGWHSPGVIGPFGGAAAAARLLGLDAERMRWAFGLAGSQAAGTFAQWGTPTIKFHQARGALSGLLAARLAAESFRSSDEILVHPDGGIFGTYSHGGDPAAVVADLGSDWELMQISLRLWPAASSIQGMVTAIFDLTDEHDLRPEQVEHMRIRLSEPTHRLHGEMAWDSRFQALLSARYTGAVVLHDRECWLDQFTSERIADPGLGAFAAQRVTTISDAAIPTYGATVEVKLRDGRTLEARRDVPHGDAADPLSREELEAKLRRSAAGLLPEDRIEQALELLLDVEQLASVGELLRCLRAR